MRKEERIKWVLASLCRISSLSQTKIEQRMPVATNSTRIAAELDSLVKRGNLEIVSCEELLEKKCYKKTRQGHVLLEKLRAVEDGIGPMNYSLDQFEKRIRDLEPS